MVNGVYQEFEGWPAVFFAGAECARRGSTPLEEDHRWERVGLGRREQRPDGVAHAGIASSRTLARHSVWRSAQSS